VQRLRRLLLRGSAREAEGAFVVEGSVLLSEALSAGAVVESVYLAPGTRPHPGVGAVWRAAREAGAQCYELAPGVLERVASTVTPQPVLAVVNRFDRPLSRLADAKLVIVCVDVRDPGNLGTVLRCAEAAGAEGVVCCGSTVDVYNPKCVRASAGAVFHVPVVVEDQTEAVLAAVGAWGLRRLGTAAGAGQSYAETDLTRPTALVLGNEAQGLPRSVETSLDGWLHIPMAGRAESLNVGMVAAVLCFEASRQRQAGGQRQASRQRQASGQHQASRQRQAGGQRQASRQRRAAGVSRG